MTRVALLFAVALIGCTSSARISESSSGAPAQRGEPDLNSSGAPAQRGKPDVKTQCSQSYAGDTRYDKCRWHMASQGYCGGAVPSREQMIPSSRCMCDGCVRDADCPGTARGRCAEVPSIDAYCVPAARVCVPDGERCPPDDAGQVNGVLWRHDGEGHATCSAERAPPP